ncbi:hypothetical protein NCTC15132_05685 [Fusobacterium sp. oral taxon C10]
MKDYEKVESCLKNFLKNNKKLGYSVALLVTFLINGGFSYADEAVQVPQRTEIKSRIEKEQENISQMLKETDENMKDIELKIKKLIQRGAFWVKPLERSTQLFFLSSVENNTKNRNRTEKNFTEPEYRPLSSRKTKSLSGKMYTMSSYGVTMADTSSEEDASSYIGSYNYNGRNYGEYGIIKNPLEFVDKIAFGANITPKAVEEKTIVEKTVQPKAVTLPVVNAPTISVSNVSVGAPPEIDVPIPTVPSAPEVNVTAPGQINPLSNINVAAVSPVNVSVAAPQPTTPTEVAAPTVTPPDTPGGFEPQTITPPGQPVAPTAPSIEVLNPPDITFNGTGFGQDTDVAFNGSQGIAAKNFGSYHSNGIDITANETTVSWNGTMSTTGGSETQLPANSSYGYAKFNTFISDVLDHDVNVTGNYTMRSTAASKFPMFVSLNPYQVGKFSQGDKTFRFSGTLNLHGTSSATSGGIVGFEHQLLAGDGSGTSPSTYVNNGSTTSILQITNGATVNLVSGYNMIGIMIDTEYFNNNTNSYFRKKPQTRNDGVIKIGTAARKSVAIDYGYYLVKNADNLRGPNTDVHLGNIEIDGEESYGYRQKYYGGQYYDQTTFTGSNGVIKVRGRKNVGISIAEGMSSGDPISNASSIQLQVGGSQNVGFLRNSNTSSTNTNDMVLDGTRIGNTFDFLSTATKSTLIRSDKNGIVLAKSLNLTAAGEKNSIMQAGKTGKVTLASGTTVTANMPKFYGLTAGDFNGSSGATATNNGTLNIGGTESIGMAIANGNTGNNSGNITLTGSSGSAIYNKGTFNLTGGTVTANGAKSSGIYSAAGTTTISNSVTITAKGGAAGIYASGGTVTSNSGANLKLNSEAGAGLAAYAGGGTINLVGATINVTNSAAGVASSGSSSMVNLTNANMTYDGNGYAVYSTNGGKVNLSGTQLTLKGKSTAFDVDLAPSAILPITLNSATRIMANSDNVVAFNLKNATNLTTEGGIEDSIKTQIAAKLGGGVSLANLFQGSTSTKYKVAAVDGGNLEVGNLDRSGTAGDTDAAKKAGYQYFNKFLAQKLKATTKANSTIKAVLSTTEPVVGFEMNSSKTASSVNDTAINLHHDSKIIADRNGSGNGAIGAFINYGVVDITAGSEINVEKESNPANEKAVGVYAVNGSIVKNAGDINVGGNQSVGILGLAQREGHPNEFGSQADQGKITIKNSKNITMSGDNAVGIFANNNNNSAASSHVVENTTGGLITVGNSTGGKTAVGIYANKVTVKPVGGKIKIGNSAVGIFANNSSVVGEAGKDLGTVDYAGESGIGIYVKGASQLNGTKLTLAQSSTGTIKGKVGLLFDTDADTTTTVKVDTGSVNDVTAYYTANKNLTVKSDLTLNENSTGVSAKDGQDLAYGDDSTTYTMTLGKSSTGIFGKGNITTGAKSKINLNAESTVGVYGSGNGKTIAANGEILFGSNSKKSVGLYALNGATITEGSNSKLTFGTSSENIGVYLAGANWVGKNALTEFKSDHSKKNIYLYAQGGASSGSTVTLKNEFKVNAADTSADGKKTIGIYLDTAAKGGGYKSNTLNTNDTNAKITALKETIGVYAKNTSDTENNILNTLKVSATGEKTVGVYADGNIKLDGTGGKISAISGGVGIYGNNSKITVANTHNVETDNAGVGMYLTNKSYLTGGELNLKNNTANKIAAGIYYTKGNSTSEVVHNTKLNIVGGSKLIALYADGGINLKNNSEINFTAGSGNIAAFVTGGSKLTNAANITSTMDNTLGVYVKKGEATNSSGTTIKVEDNSGATDTLSVGMAAAGASSTEIATVTNKGTIEAKGDAIGMNIDGHSVGVNEGTITAKNNTANTLKGIGAYVNGANASFTNKAGATISSESIALALKGTAANKIRNAGTLKLTKDNAVGVYAENSVVDFDIQTNSGTTKGTVGLYAKGTTQILKKITTATGNGHIGAYVADSKVTFGKDSEVVVNKGIETNYGVGIYTAAGYNGTVNTKITLNDKYTIGLFAGANATKGSTVTHTGTIDVGKGIGIYVPEKSKFIANGSVINVNGGTAVYLKGGAVDLGKTNKATINFGKDGGTAVFQDGGKIETGAGLTVNGSGSFLVLKNADSSINSLIKVGAGGKGITGIYDNASTADHELSLLSPNGKIELGGNGAIGIMASAVGGGHKATITNKGNIITTAGTGTIGIVGKGIYIANEGNINIGASGIGIYTTNDGANTNTELKNTGEINLNGDEAKGIIAYKTNTNKAFIGGKITGTKNRLIGMFFKSASTTVTVKDTKISLGNNAKGLVFEGSNFNVTTTSGKNQIKVGGTTEEANRSIGVVAKGSSGTIANTDVIIGAGGTKQSIGLYANGGTLTFDSTNGELKATGGNAILAYADGATSKVAINGGRTLRVGANSIGVGANSGSVTANTSTQIEVNGENGIGAYVKDNGSVSSNFDIKVKGAKGRGVYATGAVGSLAKVTEISGNSSIGYVLQDVTNHINITSKVQLTDTTATGQVGVVAQGSGAGLTLAGISVVGNNNTGVYSSTGKEVVNNGTLTIGDSTTKSSIGIYSKGGTVTNNADATIGKNAIGIYGEKTSVTSKSLNIAEKGVGIFLKNTATSEGKATVNGNIAVGANGAVGIQTTNANTTVTGNLDVANGDSKGIFSEGTGDIETKGNVTVGTNSVGIYKNGNGEIKTALGLTGKTLAVGANGYGIFSKGAKVTNNMNVTVGADAIGAYVDGNDLTSTGNVSVGGKGVGLLVKGAGKSLTSKGDITVGTNNAVGLYADGANIIQSGNMNIGDTSPLSFLSSGSSSTGIGVYSKGDGSVTTSGNITVGKDSIGIYKDGKGTMNIGSVGQDFKIGNRGYGIYYKGTTGSSVINSNMNMVLSREAVGIYGKNTTINQNGSIKVGETTIGENGYSNPDVNKNSIGIFGDNSDITYTGHMTVDRPLSVGIYASNGGSVTLGSGTVMDIKNGAMGVMTGKDVRAVTIKSGATLNVHGKATGAGTTDRNTSYGITAYSGDIKNYGTINVTGGGTGVYVDGNAQFHNYGIMNVDPMSVAQGKTPTKASANLGGVHVDINGKVTIGGKVITGGTLNIRGDLNMNGMGIDISTGKPIIDAHSITGTAYVLPNFSKGNSVQKLTIKDVFRTRPDGIGAFSGDVKSKSVSWIAKITKTPGSSTTTKDITMVRLPYQSLIVGERYKNLAGGLEDVRQSIGKDVESAIFKSLDQISSHREFGRSIAELRGDVYSNIQERMQTVEGTFDKSYNQLLDSHNVTRNVNKFSIIQTRGKHEDSTLGVTGYKYNSVGGLYLNDREGFTYGGKYGWSAGVIGTHFTFDDETNRGSKETIVSGKLGLHYQAPLNKEDDNARLKWLTRGEFTVNNHRTKRHSLVGKDTYVNKAHFYSTELSWKNTIYYDYDINTKWTVKPYVGMDLAYGHIFGIKERGNELNLQVKTKDYYVISPNVGVETKYVFPVGLTHQMFVKADAEVNYDVTKLYRETNKARIKDSSKGYYKLSEPERRRGRATVGAELGLEKENTYGVTFRAEYQGLRKKDLNYGVKFNYKF